MLLHCISESLKNVNCFLLCLQTQMLNEDNKYLWRMVTELRVCDVGMSIIFLIIATTKIHKEGV